MKINKNKFKSIIASVFLLVLVIGAAYAYLGTFNVDLSNDIAVNINSTSPGNTAFVANATQLNLQVPASSMGSYLANNTVAAMENNAVLSVSLQGANGFKTTCTYDIVYEYDSTSLVYGSSNAPVTSGATKEITLQIENVTGTNYYETERNFNYYTGSYNGNANDKWTSTTKRTLVSGATITSFGITKKQSINVIGRYYNLDAYQDLGGKAFNGTIYVENVNCSVEETEPMEFGYMTILKNNGGKTAIEAKKTPSFTQTSTTNEGMYAVKDDLGTSYYFRGAINNNWVKFGDTSKTMCSYDNQEVTSGVYSSGAEMILYTNTITNENDCNSSGLCKSTNLGYVLGITEDQCNEAGETWIDASPTYQNFDFDMYWRIVRINGDGSIRIIYAGTTDPTSETAVVKKGKDTLVTGKISYNNDGSIAESIGYQYIIGQQHGYGKCDGSINVNCGNVYNSNIKQELEKWFKNSSLFTKKFEFIADTIFCNDRTASTSITGPFGDISNWTSTGTDYNYAAYYRSQPGVYITNPILTCPSNNDKFSVNSYIGNGALTYPVGLITSDEIIFAGGKKGISNSKFYLYTGEGTTTISPISKAEVSELSSYGRVEGISINSGINAVRPVISLSSDVVLTGDGTWNNPYEVVS